ncbi:MAG: hypothetical protein OIF36_02235 [Alphaproteobacteria bacterium]|jgi:hypothetical protein|nr:hypothetical protein [Alphaproteobacteria bacterium]MCV6599286.1 hypothetical protein [Alphaproteobacteria bacterium]
MRKKLLADTGRVAWDAILAGASIASAFAIYKATNGFNFSEQKRSNDIIIINQKTNQHSEANLVNKSTIGLF